MIFWINFIDFLVYSLFTKQKRWNVSYKIIILKNTIFKASNFDKKLVYWWWNYFRSSEKSKIPTSRDETFVLSIINQSIDILSIAHQMVPMERTHGGPHGKSIINNDLIMLFQV